MSSENTNIMVENFNFLALLQNFFKQIGAKNIRTRDRMIIAEVYDFEYHFTLDNNVINYERNDGKKSSFNVSDLDLLETVLRVYYKYTKNEEQDDYVSIKISDVDVRLSLLCPGDFVIAYENCYARQCISQKSATMCYVEDK